MNQQSPDVTELLRLILARLGTIEGKLDRTAATIRDTGNRTWGDVKPGRLTTAQACEKLSCSRTTIEGCAARGVLTQLRPKGRGHGKPVYYVPEEVEALLTSEDAARELVARRKRRSKK